MKRLPACFALLLVIFIKTSTVVFAQTPYANAIFAQVGTTTLPDGYSQNTDYTQLADKGYIIGDAYYALKSFFITKTDSSGNPLWVKQYKNGVSSSYPFCNMCALPDTGYVVYTTIPSGAVCVQRHDKFGNPVWNKKYVSPYFLPAVGPGKVFYYEPSIVQVNYFSHDTLGHFCNAVMRIDLATGNLISNTIVSFPGQPNFDTDFQDAIMDTQHNTYVLTSHTLGHRSVLYQMDSSLQVINAVALTDSPAYLYLKKLSFLPDGNIVMAGVGCGGFTQGNCSSNSLSSRVLKISPAGQLLFSKKFTQVSDLPGRTALGVKNDGRILVYHTTQNPLMYPTHYIRQMLLDSSGNLISSNQFLGEDLEGMYMNQDAPTLLYKLSVWTNFIANCYVQLGTDTTGLPIPGCSLTPPSPITMGTDDSLAVAVPYQMSLMPMNNMQLSTVTDVITSGNTPTFLNYCIFDNADEQNTSTLRINTSPNPSDKQITISTGKNLQNGCCTITDVLGNQVRLIRGIQTDSFVIEKGNLPPGIYLVHITADGVSGTAKICFTE